MQSGKSIKLSCTSCTRAMDFARDANVAIKVTERKISNTFSSRRRRTRTHALLPPRLPFGDVLQREHLPISLLCSSLIAQGFSNLPHNLTTLSYERLHRSEKRILSQLHYHSLISGSSDCLDFYSSAYLDPDSSHCLDFESSFSVAGFQSLPLCVIWALLLIVAESQPIRLSEKKEQRTCSVKASCFKN